MNPELQRNLWLEVGPRRLAWAGVALAAIYGAAVLMGEDKVFRALGIAGWIVFVGAALLWGPRLAGRAVGDEVAQRTWDFQRLSALEPWDMTWGKLLGATSLAWIVAGSGLTLLLAWTAATSGAAAGVQALVAAVGAAVLLQAGSMALALVGVRRARAEGRSAAFRFTFGGVVALFVVGSTIWRTSNPGASRIGGPLDWLTGWDRAVYWWGAPVDPAWTMALSVAAFAAWSMVSAWRLMRLELQMRNVPWAWPLFLAFTGMWAAGFQAGDAPRWAVAGLVFFAGAYVSAFLEPAERVRLRQFGALAKAGRLEAAAFEAPMAIAPVAFAAVAVLGLSLAAADSRSVMGAAAFAFMLRDLGIVAYFRFGPRPTRGDFGAVVALFLAYFVGGVVGGDLGPSGAALFVPTAEPFSAVAGLVMAAIAWVLAWKRIRTPEKSEA